MPKYESEDEGQTVACSAKYMDERSTLSLWHSSGIGWACIRVRFTVPAASSMDTTPHYNTCISI